jgi:hypothetical protein
VSNNQGYLYWDIDFLRGSPYLDGSTYECLKVPGAFTWRDVGGSMLARPAVAGNHLVQKVFRGARAGNERTSFEFGIKMYGDVLEEYFGVKRSRARGAVVYFCPYVWTEEVFTAISGQTYTLARPWAGDVVPGVTSSTHPISVFLDNTLSPSSVTFSGESFTANDTGEIAIRYMPAFRAIFTGEFQEDLADVNDINVSFSLSEVIKDGMI